MAEMPPSHVPAMVKQTRENGGPGETGTPLAILDILESCNLGSRDTTSRSSWGGARNRADRVSFHLSRRQCDAMLAAANYAEQTGRTFSRHWTVHYQAAGIPENEGAAFVGKLLNIAGRNVRRAGGELAAIWSRENGESKRGHVHIALSLPPGFTLRNRTRRWIEAAGGKYRKGVSEVRIIGGTLASSSCDSDRHFANVGNVIAYLLKGADSGTGGQLSLGRSGEGGKVIGKRCGWTQNIGGAARGAAQALPTVGTRSTLRQ
jgi:hypothetical protein